MNFKSKKTKFLLMALFVLLFVFILYKAFTGEEREKRLEERVPAVEDEKTDAYQIKSGKIYYRQAGNLREVEEADIDTFEAIDDHYAKDVARVYFRNFPIEDAHVESFQVIDEKYAKDALAVYCSDISVYKKPIKGADPKTFEKVGGNFYKDKENVYEDCHVSEIPNLDPETFEIVDENMVKDKNGEYNIE
ncbi:hypothetical protein GF382_02765 [Candidatus Falkowbacteria bacterium]|nr:hypothetical protein [Candidatus Falkowbacteria bacterium]